MESFETINQFDKQFAHLGKFNTNRSACPLFGLITCLNFLSNGNISKEQHETNLQTAINTYVNNTTLPKYMSFDELVALTNTLKSNDVNATTPELLTTNIVGYEHIFRFGIDSKYCVLFLKNRNYIAVLCNNEQYAVRDCHETTQKTFANFNDLRKHLNDIYQFEQQTMAGGVRITEFENIEFVTIENGFELVNLVNVSSQNMNQEVINMDEYIAMCLMNEEFAEFV